MNNEDQLIRKKDYLIFDGLVFRVRGFGLKMKINECYDQI